MLSTTVLMAVLSCSRVAADNLNGLTVLPADGATAPRSTWLWLRSDGVEHPKLKDALGQVPVTESRVTVRGEHTVELLVLKPSTLLAANTRYTIERGSSTTTFTTDDTVDTTPPAIPAVALGNVSGAHFGAYSCGSSSVVEMSLTPAPELAVLVVTGANELGTTAQAVSRTSSLVAVGVDEGSHDFTVLALDLSGNLAKSSPVALTVPKQTSGCSAAPAAPLLVAAALGFRLQRRKTRTTSPSVR